MTFPQPFGGITRALTVCNREELQQAVLYLMACHSHNFAIDTDNLTLHVSVSGAMCLDKLFKEHK
jgi:hypothetical protein